MPEPKSPVVGAAPEGVSDRNSAARAVREMFTSIAPRYDLLNHVLSFNVDRIWWRRTARTFRHILIRPDARILDLCCGTGDMAFALQQQARKSSAQIVGADFSHAMLRRAALKPTLSIYRSLIHISTWLPRHSVSAILRITMRACEKSRAFFAPGESVEFSILASPRGSWELCTEFISSRCCLEWVH